MARCAPASIGVSRLAFGFLRVGEGLFGFGGVLVAQAEQPELQVRLQRELRVLALHGLLHLLGYDHEVDSGEMARVEARLRRRAGLPGGLIARSS